MIAKIVWIIGVIFAIWCLLDIIKRPWSLIKKIIVAVIVLATSWLGAIVYYLVRNKL